MKAKLLKTAKGHYVLVDETKETYDKGFLIATSRESDVSKLSIQNCDDIFGVVDVDKLAEKIWNDLGIFNEMDKNLWFGGFRNGFNKAMELNKDKVFTIEDMGKLWDFCINNKSSFWECLESIQQPTEIDVEIEMEYIGECNGNNGDGCFQDSPAHNCGCFQRVSKLDSNGCLILKKI